MKKMLFCLLLMPLSCLAQFKCTMPNGAVIFNRLSTCPKDAIKAETLDRVPDNVQPQFKGAYREPVPLPPAGPAIDMPTSRPAPSIAIPAPASPAATRNIVDDAYGICALLKAVGATTCKVEVNVFSASFIDATLPTTPNDAQKVCNMTATLTHKPDSPFIGRGWQLKLFSPIGSGTRPMAQCTL